MFLKVQLSCRGTERVLQRDFVPFTLSGYNLAFDVSFFLFFFKLPLLVSSAVKQGTEYKTIKGFHPRRV